MHIFVHLLAKICAHLCAFLKNLDVRIFVRLLAKICAHLSLELLATLIRAHSDSETKESYSSNSNMDLTQELRDIKNHLESLLSKKVTVPLRII